MKLTANNESESLKYLVISVISADVVHCLTGCLKWVFLRLCHPVDESRRRYLSGLSGGVWLCTCVHAQTEAFSSRLAVVCSGKVLWEVLRRGQRRWRCQSHGHNDQPQSPLHCSLCTQCRQRGHSTSVIVNISVSLLSNCSSPIILFSSLFPHLLPYLSFPLRIDLLHYQAGCRKRRLNLAYVYFVL